MKIILKQDYANLGQAGEIVDVKAGFANNLLIPRGIAITATKSNLRIFEEQKKINASKINKERATAEELAQQLEKVSCTASVAVGEEDRVFGSVTSQTIADLLVEKGFEIDKRKIVLAEPIKALGIYDVPIKLHHDVEAKVKVWVVKE